MTERTEEKGRRAKIAYIVSAKYGLPGFLHNEIRGLKEAGVEVVPYMIKSGRGPYMPPADWEVHRLGLFRAALSLILWMFIRPLVFLRLFVESVRDGGAADFAIAADFGLRMKKDGTTLIYSFDANHPLYVGYYSKRLTGIRLAVIVHAMAFYCNPNEALAGKCLRACDRIINITEYNRKLLSLKFGIEEEKMDVVRVAVDTERFRAEEEEKKILIVGQFAERKGHELLFRAVKRLGRKDIRIWVVGEGSWSGARDYVDVRGLAGELGIEDRVTFFGAVNDDVLKALYRGSDIFCLPSRTSSDGMKEGLPVVLMEAMASGKPVITTRHTGIPELVGEALVEENDVEGLSREIEKLAGDAGLRAEHSIRNRKRVEELHSMRNVLRLKEILTGL